MAKSVDEVAEQLIAAFNARDIDAVLPLLDKDVVLDFGPKVLQGRDEALDFVKRQLFGVGISTTHGRRFMRGNELVAESRQQMSFVDSGELASEEQIVGLYVARDKRLIRYREFPDLASAFNASAVTEGDEIFP